MQRLSIVIASLLTACVAASFATTLVIPDDFDTIQEGLEAASPLDTVLVSPGTYTEELVVPSDSLILGSLFLITGDSSFVNNTILDGEEDHGCILIQDLSSIEIAGFTIANGQRSVGSGIWTQSGSSNVSFHDMVFINCQSVEGGALYISTNDFVHLENCAFYGSDAYNGGALYLRPPEESIIRDLYFENNSGTCDVAHVQFEGDGSIENFIFKDNEADHMIFNCYSRGRMTIRNVTLVSNLSVRNEAMIHCNNSDILTLDRITTINSRGEIDLQIEDCDTILISNSAFVDPIDVTATGIQINGFRQAFLLNSVINGFQYNPVSCISECSSTIHASHNLVEDGRFGFELDGGIDFVWENGIEEVWPDYIADEDGFRLQPWSACVDAGTQVFSQGSDTLLNISESIIAGPAPDLGPTEFFGSHPEAFDLVSPDHQALLPESTVELLWQEAVNPDSGETVTYHVYVAENMDDLYRATVAATVETNCTFDAELGCTYYWTVLADDIHSGGTYASAVRTFSIITQGVDDDAKSGLPGEFAVSEAFPNPFNPTTQVTLSLPEATDVGIRLLNLNGRVVQNLHATPYSAGVHTLEIDCSGFASGVYFLQVQADAYRTVTRKIWLVK